MSKEGEDGCEGTNLFSKLPSMRAGCQLWQKVSGQLQNPMQFGRDFYPTIVNNFYARGIPCPIFLLHPRKICISFSLVTLSSLMPTLRFFFWLDKWSGKKCFMIPFSVKLYPEGDWDPSYESRYFEAYGSHCEEWIGIHGKISTSMLSPDTTYTAYLVHKWYNGFGYNISAENRPPFEVSVGCSEDESFTRVVYLDRKIGETGSQYVVERKDGWLEVELGEYFNKGGENKDLEMSVMDVTTGLSKTAFQTQGIEIRPKHD